MVAWTKVILQKMLKSDQVQGVLEAKNLLGDFIGAMKEILIKR